MKNKIRFNLFLLHDPKKDETRFGRIQASGRHLNKNVKLILSDIYTKIKRRKLDKILCKRLKISDIASQRLRAARRKWFSLIFLEVIILIWGESLGKTSKEVSSLREKIMDSIDYLASNTCNRVPIKAPKHLTINICKIAGAHAADGTLAKDGLFRITDYYYNNLKAFQKWIKREFGLNYDIKIMKDSSQEFCIEFRNKVFSRYLSKLLGFNVGCKQYTVREPKIIKSADMNMRKSFLLGLMTFEAGIGIKRVVQLSVANKDLRDDVSDVLNLLNIQHYVQPKPSKNIWRLMSKELTRITVEEWLDTIEKNTEKWKLLFYIKNGFPRKVSSYSEAKILLDRAYPKKGKTCVSQILDIIREYSGSHRYKISEEICRRNNLQSFGGKWSHSLHDYLEILKRTRMIKVEKKRFGKKKSFGTIVREIYTYDEKVENWRLPDF